MLYELVLSLRQCVYALLGAERSLPWFALLPPIVLALMIVPLVGCGDKSGDKPAPARCATWSSAPRQRFPLWKEPARSMRTMRRP